MKKLIFKLFLLTFPLQIVLCYFVFADPMKLFFDNKNPVSKGVLMNDRYYQIEYLKTQPKTYNSFIFGSSRSKAFRTINWKKFLPNSSRPYHMGVNDESIYGVLMKLKYLHKNRYEIKHALIQIDPRLLSMQTNSEAHVFRDHYEASGESASNFYQHFFKAFLNTQFLRNYINFKLSGKIENKIQNIFLWDPGFIVIPETGDIIYSRYDNLISKDSIDYYKKLKLKQREEITSPKLLNNTARAMIFEIKSILKNQNTNYKICLSPNFDLCKLSFSDKVFLQSVFNDQLFDFSGKNNYTIQIGNYYEVKHFKPYVANDLMNIMYGKK